MREILRSLIVTIAVAMLTVACVANREPIMVSQVAPDQIIGTWTGAWSSGNHGGNAELTIYFVGAHNVYGKLIAKNTPAGTKFWSMSGTVDKDEFIFGNLKFSLSRGEDGVLHLDGISVKAGLMDTIYHLTQKSGN